MFSPAVVNLMGQTAKQIQNSNRLLEASAKLQRQYYVLMLHSQHVLSDSRHLLTKVKATDDNGNPDTGAHSR